MRVKGIAWLGARTDRFGAMVRFAREVLGLIEPSELKPDAVAVFDLPNGDLFELFGPSDVTHAFMTCPVGGFLVDDVEQARRKWNRRELSSSAPSIKPRTATRGRTFAPRTGTSTRSPAAGQGRPDRRGREVMKRESRFATPPGTADRFPDRVRRSSRKRSHPHPAILPAWSPALAAWT